jgi:hypothetical protein
LDLINNKQKYILSFLILLFSLFAWLNRFIQDDAFISFRYAHNLAEGFGLVYNPGERVEGYSNFLWTIILSIPHLLNIDAVVFSQAAGILLFAVSLSIVYRLAYKLTGSFYLAAAALVFTGSNYTFLCYATGGLETQLFTCLFLSALYSAFQYTDEKGRRGLVLVSFLLSALLLTRPDSVPYTGLILAYLLFKMYKSKPDAKKYTPLLIPLALTASVFLVWKYTYYGDILPNTYYAKLSVNAPEKYGLYYLFTFSLSYLLIIFPPVFVLLLNRKDLSPEAATLFASLAFNIAYIIFVGGDFMEFRLLVPVLPVFFILVVMSFKKINRRTAVFILSLIIIAGSVNHALTYKSDKKYRLYSIKELNGEIYNDNFGWMKTGILLGKYFKDKDEDITIATTAAGAIPYYSRLRTIDMHGLNDKHIALSVKAMSGRPGHQKLADFSYLEKQNVNLLIGHPFVMWKTFSIESITPAQFRSYFMYNISQMPAGTEIIKMPLQNNYCVFFVYLQKNKKIDEVIKREGWETIANPK